MGVPIIPFIPYILRSKVNEVLTFICVVRHRALRLVRLRHGTTVELWNACY